MKSKKDLGEKGEAIAIDYLKDRGYNILQTNFRSKFGEIDIIAKDKDTLVFIEVKTRTSKQFGLPEESIRPWKLKTIERVGSLFRLLNPDMPEAERIDVVAIELDEDGNLIRKEIIKNAFL